MKSRPSEGADFALGQTEIPFVGRALGRGCSLCGSRWLALGLRVQPVRKPVARLGPRVQPVRKPVACDGPRVQPVWKPVARLGAAEKNKEELRTPLYCVPRADTQP